jgi:CubicO group peptidase (beta-lactamase class C family)
MSLDVDTLQGFTQAGIAAFNAVFHQMVDQRKLANVVTLISHHGKIANIDAYGVLDVSARPQVPVMQDSIFRIASMTKPITGVAMMILWEEGKWALEDPVAKHIPEFRDLKVRAKDGRMVPQTKPMTMKQLMSHSAGFGSQGEYNRAKLRRGNLQDMIHELASQTLFFQPGKEWRYGPSVDIQGYLVEKLSGQGLDQFFEQRIFRPLGMTDTGFWVHPSKASRVSRMHRYGLGGGIVVAPFLSTFPTSKPMFLSGSGGLTSTIQDYWRFCQMVLNGGEFEGRRFLRADTVKLMHTNVLEPGVEVTITAQRGLGFGLDFAIVQDPAAASTSVAAQSFFWGGAFGTWFWIDPVNELIVIGMIQNAAGTTPAGAPDVREASAQAVYAALRGQRTPVLGSGSGEGWGRGRWARGQWGRGEWRSGGRGRGQWGRGRWG